MTESTSPKGWQRVPLGKLISDLQPGFASRPSSTGRPQLRPYNITSDGQLDLSELKYVPEKTDIDKFLIRDGDILFNNTNSPEMVGKTCFCDVPGTSNYVFSNHLTRIRINKSVADPIYISRYLHYLWSQCIFQEACQQWINQAAIPTPYIEKLPIPLPPLVEQQEIVHILQKADSLLQLRTEADRLSEQILPALFIETFGDPVTNPKRWPIKELGRVCTPTETRDPTLSPDTTFEYIDIASVDNKTGRIIRPKTLLGKNAPSRARKVIRHGDVIVATTRPYLNATALVLKELDEQVCSTGFCVLRPSNQIRSLVVYTLTRTRWFVEQLTPKMRGSTYPAVSDQDVFNIAFPCPPVGLQDDFVQKANRTTGEQTNQAIARQQIRGIREALLTRAFTGELTAGWRRRNSNLCVAEPIFARRQEVVLALLNELAEQKRQEVLLTQMMKYLFLTQMQDERPTNRQTVRNRLYQFEPYLYGPFAKELYSDLEELEQEKVIERKRKPRAAMPQEEFTLIHLTTLGRDIARRAAECLDENLRNTVRKVVAEFGHLTYDELLERVYRSYPRFAKKALRKQLVRSRG